MKPASKRVLKTAEFGHVERLRYVGTLDYEKFLSAIRKWYSVEGYEFHEMQYKHKVPSPAGMDQEMRWTGWKKMNPYVRYWVDVFFHAWDMKEVDMVEDGQRVKRMSCRLLVEFSGQVELDFTKRFAGSKFLQGLQDWYHKYIIRKEIENLWYDELYYKVLKIYSTAKKALDLATAHNAAARRFT